MIDDKVLFHQYRYLYCECSRFGILYSPVGARYDTGDATW